MLVLGTPGVALAQRATKVAPASNAANLVATGRSLFDDQRYDESIQALSAALLRPGTSKQDRVEIYRLLAYNYIVLRHNDEAEAAVRGLYAIDPDFALGRNESPRFRSFFSEVKRRWDDEGRPGLVTEQAPAPKAVAIQHASPPQQEMDKEVPISGDVQDPGARTASVVLHYRTGSTGRFTAINAQLADGHFRATIPAAAIKPPLVEYYLEALDSAGLPVATRGDVASPLRIAVPEPQKSSSIWASPWFWTGATAVVVGGVVGALVLTHKSDSGASSAPNSRVIVVVGP